jgi:hypothetical protein
MTIRTIVISFAGAGLLASAPALAAHAGTDGWRFVTVHRSLNACQTAGRNLVGRHQARAYRCENDYDKAGVPVLDLYVR